MLNADHIMGYEPTLKALSARGAEQAALHERAAATAMQAFGRQVFMRAVVEVSNFCRENCHYCGMRRDNRALARARASHEALVDLISHCRLAAKLPLRGCSVSPFVPGDQTPLAAATPGDIETTLNCMAVLRLMRPDWVIPAVSALNLAQPGLGYRRGQRAGANMVTTNLTPRDLQRGYVIYRRDRFIMSEERVLGAIAAEGLALSPRSLAAFCRNAPPREAICPPAATAARYPACPARSF